MQFDNDMDGTGRRFPKYTCSATVSGCRGTQRRCRMPVREDGARCKHHIGQPILMPPDQPCTGCWSYSWEPVDSDTPNAVLWRDGYFLCALCSTNDRAHAAEAAIQATLAFAENVASGHGAVDDVCQFIRARLSEIGIPFKT